eukprot:TRINITY_DN1758_c1_g1_i1.p1 TRINITY_DN1758_c1_g1~~TRINITY_DN1758_c1_g1_i1.p1  ORF type:complete len:1374 (+),score=363.11 TRINITY_DN1758_c1_g1_i1:123-4124(+)
MPAPQPADGCCMWGWSGGSRGAHHDAGVSETGEPGPPLEPSRGLAAELMPRQQGAEEAPNSPNYPDPGDITGTPHRNHGAGEPSSAPNCCTLWFRWVLAAAGMPYYLAACYAVMHIDAEGEYSRGGPVDYPAARPPRWLVGPPASPALPVTWALLSCIVMPISCALVSSVASHAVSMGLIAAAIVTAALPPVLLAQARAHSVRMPPGACHAPLPRCCSDWPSSAAILSLVVDTVQLSALAFSGHGWRNNQFRYLVADFGDGAANRTVYWSAFVLLACWHGAAAVVASVGGTLPRLRAAASPSSHGVDAGHEVPAYAWLRCLDSVVPGLLFITVVVALLRRIDCDHSTHADSVGPACWETLHLLTALFSLLALAHLAATAALLSPLLHVDSAVRLLRRAARASARRTSAPDGAAGAAGACEGAIDSGDYAASPHGPPVTPAPLTTGEVALVPRFAALDRSVKLGCCATAVLADGSHAAVLTVFIGSMAVLFFFGRRFVAVRDPGTHLAGPCCCPALNHWVQLQYAAVAWAAAASGLAAAIPWTAWWERLLLVLAGWAALLAAMYCVLRSHRRTVQEGEEHARADPPREPNEPHKASPEAPPPRAGSPSAAVSVATLREASCPTPQHAAAPYAGATPPSGYSARDAARAAGPSQSPAAGSRGSWDAARGYPLSTPRSQLGRPTAVRRSPAPTPRSEELAPASTTLNPLARGAALLQLDKKLPKAVSVPGTPPRRATPQPEVPAEGARSATPSDRRGSMELASDPASLTACFDQTPPRPMAPEAMHSELLDTTSGSDTSLRGANPRGALPPAVDTNPFGQQPSPTARSSPRRSPRRDAAPSPPSSPAAPPAAVPPPEEGGQRARIGRSEAAERESLNMAHALQAAAQRRAERQRAAAPLEVCEEAAAEAGEDPEAGVAATPRHADPTGGDQNSQEGNYWNANEDQEDEADYRPGGYHPVRVGDVYADRHEILCKLGWGQFSTVWLSRDRRTGEMNALKISKSAEQFRRAANYEADILSRLNEHAQAAGEPLRSYSRRVVRLTDCFEITGPHGTHHCMSLEVMGPNLLKLVSSHDFQGIAPLIVKTVAQQILQGLAFLAEMDIAHADLKPENILLATQDASVLRAVAHQAQGEDLAPSSSDIASSEAILRGEYLPPRRGETLGQCLGRQYGVKISDFGAARWCQRKYPVATIQTREYRCPEVLIGAPKVGPPIDVWSTACIVFELITGDFLFDPKNQTEFDKDLWHWVLIMQVLGEPPASYTKGTGKFTSKFFDKRGKLRVKPLERTRLRTVFMQNYGMAREEATQLESFMAPMLAYDPAKRVSARQAAGHPWLSVS